MVDDQRLIGLCLLMLAYAPPIRADQATTRLKQSAAHFRAAGDAWGEAFTVAGVGDMAMRDGDFAVAEECLIEYVRRTRTRGDLRGLGQGLQTLGTLVLLRKAYQSAAALLLESISICRGVKHTERIARCLRGLACVAAARQEWVLTARLLGAADGFDSREAPLASTEALFTHAGDEALAHLGLASFAEAQTVGRLQVLDELLDDLRRVVHSCKEPGS
jgi:acetyl-CoA acetyltransferase